MSGHFTLEIGGAARADVFLACADQDPSIWPVVKRFDEAGVCVVGEGPLADAVPERAAAIARACAGVAVVMPAAGAAPDVMARIRGHIDLAAQSGQPLAILETGAGAAPITAAIEAVAAAAVNASVVRPYAFFIGRLERDFTHARAAIRAAVEREAGIACLWSDSDHQTNVASVRESTRLLIRHAAFVVADLTLGVENPNGENPSRAHEIGMSIAYERPLMLSSQEPRRYPYFSIGDMQMAFWDTEAQLHAAVAHWIRARRGALARVVLNHQLPDRFPGYRPAIAAPDFVYDPLLRYVGPWTPVSGREP